MQNFIFVLAKHSTFGLDLILIFFHINSKGKYVAEQHKNDKKKRQYRQTLLLERPEFS
ncbi:hypothetical protein HYE44_00820 [Mycoplasmopsis bovis]|nr:hypothetical protein [Mycoplasmopsis bovis]QQH19921.1 hypothetical protein HYE44_00820 [Mycoplasmopsis bovis]